VVWDSIRFVDLCVALEEALGVAEFPMQDWIDNQLERYFLGVDRGQGVLAFTLAGAVVRAFSTPWLGAAAAGTCGFGRLLVARGQSWYLLLAK
jgi:hypothetical protein